MTEQLAENIQPDAPIGLVLEHLYKTAGLCVRPDAAPVRLLT